jgi:hypothetical protein
MKINTKRVPLKKYSALIKKYCKNKYVCGCTKKLCYGLRVCEKLKTGFPFYYLPGQKAKKYFFLPQKAGPHSAAGLNFRNKILIF